MRHSINKMGIPHYILIANIVLAIINYIAWKKGKIKDLFGFYCTSIGAVVIIITLIIQKL